MNAQTLAEMIPTRPQPVGWSHWMEQPHVKWAVPIPLLLAIAPIVWLFFRGTWRELDEEAFHERKRLHDLGRMDYRPLVALALAAVILTVQEYYGGRALFDEVIRPWLVQKPRFAQSLARYEELYALGWWALARMGGYLLPLLVWAVLFRRESILDLGLRTRGFLEHAWIYAIFVAIMIPVMTLVARQPDFGGYYPFYRNASRSWLDLAMWETIYIGQFFCLEVFFRGWWVRATRVFGVGAIFSMVVPYCMIHYGKPYLEACGAIVAGTVLGSLSMRTRSIYAGFLVHITVAVLMDFLALERRNALPRHLVPTGEREYVFRHLYGVFWGVWAFAILLLVIQLVRHRQAIARTARGVRARSFRAGA